jgi:Na+:H+ antiporter, NhaA family
MIVIIGACLAILWANTYAESYFRFAHALFFATNDIGMAFFFAMVTKEVVEATLPGGDLHTWRRAALPMVAAVGGVLGAVLAYAAYLQFGDEASVLGRGWPTACASDIVVGYLVAGIIGKRYHAIPFLLLLTVAIDALSLVIVEVRSSVADIHSGGFVLVALGIGAAFALRRRRVKSFWPYVLMGGGASWAGLFVCGLHPAVALVPIMPFIPHPSRDPGFFVETPPGFRDALSRFEHVWKRPVAVVLLLFGLVNGGVLIQGSGTGTGSVLVASLVGKPIGILIALAAALAAGLHVPSRFSWRDAVVIAMIASIGFTFSLFFATAVFPTGPVLTEIKVGALLTVAGAPVAVLTAAMLRVGRFAR